jgi:hypothetical protein
MNVRGPCSGCGAQLATDQRYCVECGRRVGPALALPYALPARTTAADAPKSGQFWKLPIAPEMASLLAALALGLGVVMGTAISPNLAGIVAAPGPTVVAAAPPAAPTPAPPAASGGGGGSAGPATAFSPSTVGSAFPTGSSGGGGGGGGGGGAKKKEKKRPPSTGTTFSGTVVRSNPVAQSYTVATGSGLIAIHADTLPVVGAQVESVVRKLHNGTYAESGARTAVGTADIASLRGTVTYCADLEHPAVACDGSDADDHYVYAVSSLGASILVSWPHSSSTPPPAIGSQVQVAVKIGTTFTPVNPLAGGDWASYESPCSNPGSEKDGVPVGPTTATELTQTALNFNGAAATSGTLEAVVQQTNCAAHPLVLSTDDVRQAGRDLPGFDLPAGIDQAKLKRGQAVQVAVDISASGNLSLKGITSDQGSGGADDASQGQGTLTGS